MQYLHLFPDRDLTLLLLLQGSFCLQLPLICRVQRLGRPLTSRSLVAAHDEVSLQLLLLLLPLLLLLQLLEEVLGYCRASTVASLAHPSNI